MTTSSSSTLRCRSRETLLRRALPFWLAALALGPSALAASPQNPVKRELHGLGFSPFIDGQDPNQGDLPTAQQVAERLDLVADDAEWIRTFGVAGGLSVAGHEIHQRGRKAAIGAWLGPDASANQQELQTLIQLANAGEVDLAIVGSEVLLRGDLEKHELVTHLRSVRASIPVHVPVATADVYGVFLAHPDLIDELDVVLANIYPYWEGVPVEEAPHHLSCRYDAVVAAAGSKPVWISETGWPSDGDPVGAAVPSPANAARYFARFVSWANRRQTRYFWFSALDEEWKATYEGPQGAHWGLRDKWGVLKPGRAPVFAGLEVVESVDACSVVGGPGQPEIELVHVPPVGSTNDLEGSMTHVNPLLHTVTVCIRVGGNWWMKPYFDERLTLPASSGEWITDITTGGQDTTADKIAAFLLPVGYYPPAVGNTPTIPQELFDNALDWVEVDR